MTAPRAIVLLAAGVVLAGAATPVSVSAQQSRRPPACAASTAGQHVPTIDDVVRLRGEGLARVNPFGAYDLSADGRRIAVQLKRRLVDVRAHATSSFFWLHQDVGVYDVQTSRQIAYLGGAERGESWGAPFWSPSGRYLAVAHVGPASLDRQLFTWDIGKHSPVQLVPGALATSLRIAIGVPNSRAGAYAWIDSVTMIAATLPSGSGTLDQDDAMVDWPRLWLPATTGQHASASIIDAHLPASVEPAHATLGVPLTLWKIDVRSGARHALVTLPSVRGRTPRDILVSRDARWVAFTPDVRPIDPSLGPLPTLNRAETELLLVSLRDGRVLHPLPGRHVTLTRWSADDSTVGARLDGDTVVQVRRDGSVVRSVPPVIMPVRRGITAPESAGAAISRGRVVTRVDGKGEHLLVVRGTDSLAILSVDADVARLAVCPRWYVRYATRVGDTVYARVTMPPRYIASTRYPVIVQMYPGTVHTASDARSDTVAYVPMGSSWEPTLLASRGYVVVEPSIPLSGGGADHASEFAGDILPAIDSLVAYGVADPDRLGIDGVSFGGYGTAMVIEETHRFKAASARNGLYDLVSMYGQFGPPRRLADDAGEQLWAAGWAEGGQGHLGTPPYGNWDAYRRASPLTNVDSITTPVLIAGADMDYAAPLAQSEELFTALNRLGKPVRFVRYAGEAHGNASAAGLQHLLGEMTRWFDAWLAPRAAQR